MAKWISATQAKSNLSSLVNEVAEGKNRFLIERRGRPVAALVSVEALQRLEQDESSGHRPRGALALVGLWADVPDEEIDAMVKEIYAARERDLGRPIHLEP